MGCQSQPGEAADPGSPGSCLILNELDLNTSQVFVAEEILRRHKSWSDNINNKTVAII